MTDKNAQLGALAPGAITIDPRVAMIEERLLAQAIEAHLKNRNLFLAQRVFELENPPTMTKPDKPQAAPKDKN